jgi:hypothetical protein
MVGGTRVDKEWMKSGNKVDLEIESGYRVAKEWLMLMSELRVDRRLEQMLI